MFADLNTTVKRFGVRRMFFKEINNFMHQGLILLIKSDTKDIYNFTKVSYIK